MALIAKVGRKKIKSRLLIIGILLFLWIGIALHLFPVYWMFTATLKGNIEIFQFPPTLWPKEPTWYVYTAIFSGLSQLLTYPLWIYFKNSVILTGGIMIMQIPLSAAIAYSLSKLQSPRWSRILFLFFVATMFIPSELVLVPNYLFMSSFPFITIRTTLPHINLLDTYWAIILFGLATPFNILLLKGTFDGIPDELINAARLDGASELSIIKRVILPITKPVFAVVAYFTFSGTWASFMWPYIVLKSEKMYPLSVALYKAQWETGLLTPQSYRELPHLQGLVRIGWNGIMVIGIFESIPVFIMFLIFREYLMTGIKLRGFK